MLGQAGARRTALLTKRLKKSGELWRKLYRGKARSPTPGNQKEKKDLQLRSGEVSGVTLRKVEPGIVSKISRKEKPLSESKNSGTPSHRKRVGEATRSRACTYRTGRLRKHEKGGSGWGREGGGEGISIPKEEDLFWRLIKGGWGGGSSWGTVLAWRGKRRKSPHHD